ncbi:MAG: segregation/condensation protein A, partial [Rhodospirillaceae bacterium]|nr:segregation/condensation protein A [Rhodospirillaceae bacterium]
EGPIDVLLTLAREQKVDLTRISILELADQYLAFIARARHLRLEIAADYLVMAAWLAYLKSRLLLPEPAGPGEPTGAEMAAALAFQLRRLEAMQEAGAKLMARPQLGRDVFARGAPEPVEVVKRPVFTLSLYELLGAYGHIAGRRQQGVLRILPAELYSMDDALRRLRAMIGHSPDWRSLMSFLPEEIKGALWRRSVVAATFAASLELVRSGQAELRQERPFGPIFLRAAKEPRPDPDRQPEPR